MCCGELDDISQIRVSVGWLFDSIPILYTHMGPSYKSLKTNGYIRLIHRAPHQKGGIEKPKDSMT